MRNEKRIAAAALACLLLFLLTACRIYDGPPKDDGTPEPPAHEGTFVSEYGTMVFNGDGKSVELEIGSEMAELTGLPEGSCKGTYVFKANTPPHVYEYRYDKANEFHLTVDGKTVVFGHSMGRAAEDTIALYITGKDGKAVDLVFEKKGK